MEKLCNRCQFRTPQTRAICHVCGHGHFTKIDDSVNARYSVTSPIKTLETEIDKRTTVITEAFSVMGNKVMSACRAKLSAAFATVSGATTNLKHASEDPSQTASKLLQNRLPKTSNRHILENEPKAAQSPVSEVSVRVFSAPAGYDSSPKEYSQDWRLLPTSDFSSTSTDTTAQTNELNMLLQWFRSCGADNLVLPPGTPRQHTEAASSDDMINRAA